MTSEVELYKENVKVFDLQGKLLGMQDKTQFYKEIREEFRQEGKVSRQVHTVRLFLLNASGGLYLAKRSSLKKENALLYDKTIGAHIRGDESPEFTILRECAEELGFPAGVLKDTEFATALTDADLRIVGVSKEIDTLNSFMAHYKYKDGKTATFPQVTTIYVGVFDGPVKFKDGETSGIEIYYPNEILAEIKKNPKKYTEDVKELIPQYLDEIKTIASQIPSKYKKLG